MKNKQLKPEEEMQDLRKALAFTLLTELTAVFALLIATASSGMKPMLAGLWKWPAMLWTWLPPSIHQIIEAVLLRLPITIALYVIGLQLLFKGYGHSIEAHKPIDQNLEEFLHAYDELPTARGRLINLIRVLSGVGCWLLASCWGVCGTLKSLDLPGSDWLIPTMGIALAPCVLAIFAGILLNNAISHHMKVVPGMIIYVPKRVFGTAGVGEIPCMVVAVEILFTVVCPLEEVDEDSLLIPVRNIDNRKILQERVYSLPRRMHQKGHLNPTGKQLERKEALADAPPVNTEEPRQATTGRSTKASAPKSQAKASKPKAELFGLKPEDEQLLGARAVVVEAIARHRRNEEQNTITETVTESVTTLSFSAPASPAGDATPEVLEDEAITEPELDACTEEDIAALKSNEMPCKPGKPESLRSKCLKDFCAGQAKFKSYEKVDPVSPVIIDDETEEEFGEGESAETEGESPFNDILKDGGFNSGHAE